MEKLDFKPGVASKERGAWLNNRIRHLTNELGKIEAGARGLYTVCYMYDELNHVMVPVSAKGQPADLMKELEASYQIEHRIPDEVKRQRRVRAMHERMMATDTPTLRYASSRSSGSWLGTF